ncbi:MAG TPA: hypothetical protein VF719_03270 [Abditibacteriaceae bacterium]|jgi:hypothetical protein
MNMPFDLERSTAVRVVVGFALALMLLGFFAPLAQIRSSAGWVASGGSLLYSHSFLDKVSLLLLLGIGAGCVVAAATERYTHLARLAYAAFGVTALLFLLHIIGYLFNGQFSLALFLPAWLFTQPHLAFGYAWTLLIGAAGILCYAAFLTGEAPELMALQQQVEATANRRTAQPHKELAPEVTTFLKVIAGVVIFAFCFEVPLLGFFFWKFLEEEESPHTKTALVGWILGFICWALILLGKIADVLDKVV